MLNSLCSYSWSKNETDPTLLKFMNQTVKEITLADDKLTFSFENGSFHLWDNGQSCCEHRYMNTDDNLEFYKDSQFLGVELGDSSEIDDKDHEVLLCQFLKVHTSKGSFTVANYNSHNGYYGGFNLEAKEN